MGSDPQSHLQYRYDHARPDLQQEIWRLKEIVKSQVEALTHWRREYDKTQLEARVREWVVNRLGPANMNRRERAMRILEEAAELAQAEHVDAEVILDLLKHVFSRPPGNAVKEAGGVAVTLFGWCASAETTLVDIATREIERIESLPTTDIHASHERKVREGIAQPLTLVVQPPRKHQPFEYDLEDGVEAPRG